MSEHTPGKLEILDGFGQDGKGNCRYYIGYEKQIQPRFCTIGGNDKANAERLVLCWNAHDALLEACEAWKTAVTKGEMKAKGLGSEMLVGDAIEKAKAAIELAKEVK